MSLPTVSDIAYRRIDPQARGDLKVTISAGVAAVDLGKPLQLTSDFLVAVSMSSRDTIIQCHQSYEDSLSRYHTHCQSARSEVRWQFLLPNRTESALHCDRTPGQRGGKNLSCGMSWMYVSPRLCPQSCPHVS